LVDADRAVLQCRGKYKDTRREKRKRKQSTKKKKLTNRLQERKPQVFGASRGRLRSRKSLGESRSA